MNPARFVSRLTRKRGSNVFYAFLCLPRPQREALYAVDAFYRTVAGAAGWVERARAATCVF